MIMSLDFSETITRKHSNRQTRAMDLTKLSSRIICSDNITKQSLNKQPVVPSTPGDDDQFFQRITSEIDKNLLCSKENYTPNDNYQYTSLKRKRSIIDEETQNVIRRFKKDRNDNSHPVQTLRDISISECNHIQNNTKERVDIITNTNANNTVRETNMFSSDILTTNLRNPFDNCVFRMASNLQKNILPLTTNETPLFQEEYEESLLYTMFLTPPNSNSVEDNEGSETCGTLNTML